MNKNEILHLMISEITALTSSVTDEKIDEVISLLDKSTNIVTIGAGRMGYSLKAFTMRLSHLGYNAYHLNDTTLPRIGENDLVIVASSSGETPSIKLLTEIAVEHKSTIMLFTQDADSSIAAISDCVVLMNKIESKLTMKTAPEASTYILYDIIATKILESKDESKVIHNHSILE